MYSMNDMVAVDGNKIQGPMAGPIDYAVIYLMRTYNVPVMYKNGNKYVKDSDVQISISWDIHR